MNAMMSLKMNIKLKLGTSPNIGEQFVILYWNAMAGYIPCAKHHSISPMFRDSYT